MSGYAGWKDYKPTIGKVRSKFGAKRTEIDGLTFDSKREAARYLVLVARMKAGDLRRLRCQPRYALCALVIEHADIRDINRGANSPRRVPVCEYVADFEYEERDSAVTWNVVVEDAKGARTDVYKLKRRWFETQYGMAIRES